MTPWRSSTRTRPASDSRAPAHPKVKALVLMAAVAVAVVLLAVMTTFGAR